MDQILFLFDVDHTFPLEIDPNKDEDDQEAAVCLIKETCLRFLLFGHNSLSPRLRDLPSFSYRLFSSSEYFPTTGHSSGKFSGLNIESLGTLEAVLDNVCEFIMGIAKKESARNPSYFSTYLKSKGHRSPCENIKNCLEDVSALYEWNQPCLWSPKKMGDTRKETEGNQVILFTKLPRNLEELNIFLKDGITKYNHKSIARCLFSKKLETFSSDLGISLHIVDTGSIQEKNVMDHGVLLDIQKALKIVRGNLVPISCISTESDNEGENLDRVLLASNENRCALSSTSVFRKCMRNTVFYRDKPMHEFRVKFQEKYALFQHDSDLAELDNFFCDGFILKTKVIFELSVAGTYSCSSAGSEASTLLRYILTTKRCAVLRRSENESSGIILLQAVTEDCGLLWKINRIDSKFLSRLIELSCIQSDLVKNTDSGIFPREETKLRTFRRYTKRIDANEKGWDVNSLEKWRIPDRSNNRLKHLLSVKGRNSQRQRREALNLQHRVRKHYIPKGSICIRNELEECRSSTSFKSYSELGKEVTIDAKKKSPMVSGREAKSRQTSTDEDIQSPSWTQNILGKIFCDKNVSCDKEETVETKNRISKEILNKFLISFEIENEDHVINFFKFEKEKLINSAEHNNIDLGSFAEFSVLLVLRHLDSTGGEKSCVGDFITSNFLLPVSNVSELYTENCMKIKENKVQILLQCEVYWLLAKRDLVIKYEESILEHLRQLSLHSSLQNMTNFLQTVLINWYADRQPELMCLLHDELELDRPDQLMDILSPVKSNGPCSSSSRASTISLSDIISVQGVSAVERKIPLARMKSFESSLKRQINISKGAKKIDSKKASSQVKKNVGKERTRTTGYASKKVSGKKKALGSSKSPKKGAYLAKRNLCFDKSPRKKISTPSKKSKSTPVKMTPGKQHRVIVPDTPKAKLRRKKSDGNRSIFDTPEKELPSYLTSVFHQKSQFYSNNHSRNVAKYEDLTKAQTLGKSTHCDLIRRDSEESVESGNQNIFSQVIQKKRKRFSSGNDDTCVTRKAIKLDMPQPSRRRASNTTSLYADDNIFSLSRTPKKKFSNSGNLDNDIANTSVLNDICPHDFSPQKKVSFNSKPLSATPKREGFHAKTILKTPCKDSPLKIQTSSLTGKNFLYMTPSKNHELLVSDTKPSPVDKDLCEPPSSPLSSPVLLNCWSDGPNFSTVPDNISIETKMQACQPHRLNFHSEEVELISPKKHAGRKRDDANKENEVNNSSQIVGIDQPRRNHLSYIDNKNACEQKDAEVIRKRSEHKMSDRSCTRTTAQTNGSDTLKSSMFKSKELAGLYDKLSDYFCVDRETKRTPRQTSMDTKQRVSHGNAISTSKNSRCLKCRHCETEFRTRKLFLGHREWCPAELDTGKDAKENRKTPVDELGRKSRRIRAPVSYEESVAEFDCLSPSETFADDGIDEESLKEKSKLAVKTLVEFEEIKDIDSDFCSLSNKTSPSPSPEKLGKYFSIGGIEETTDGTFKIRLNRVEKKRTALLPTTNVEKNNFYIPRVSRSAAKDIGLSPQKLAQLLIDSPKGEKKKENQDQTPEKQRTPKLRIKRLKSSFPEENEWTAETIDLESTMEISTTTNNMRGSYSSPSSASIQKLTSSPILDLEAKSVQNREKQKKKRKKNVNKKLLYEATNIDVL